MDENHEADTPSLPQPTPVQRLTDALSAKGYKRLASYTVTPLDTHTVGWRVFAKHGHVLILQIWEDGGCELYRPLCEANSLAETIAAIP